MALLRSWGLRAEGVLCALPERPATSTNASLLLEVLARVRVLLTDPVAPSDREVVPVSLLFGGSAVRADAAPHAAPRLTYLASTATSTSWASMLLVREQLLAGAIDVVLDGPRRVVGRDGHDSICGVARRALRRGPLRGRGALHRGRLRELSFRWLLPDVRRIRNPIPATALLHVSGWVLHLALSSWHLRGGAGSASLAWRWCAGMAAPMVEAC